MNVMIKKLAVIVFLFPFWASSASFDCAKAFSDVEKLICNTPELSKADDELYIDYLQAKMVTGNSDDFRALVKKNWDLRVKNCDTKSCLMDWYHKSGIIYRNIAANHPINEQDVSGKNYYYGSSIKLRGTIKVESDGFPSIRTDDIISVSSKDPEPENGEPDEWGIAVMQLAASGNGQYNELIKNKDKKAIITCNLYHAHTIHHKTPVVCWVEGFSIIK